MYRLRGRLGPMGVPRKKWFIGCNVRKEDGTEPKFRHQDLKV